MCPFRQKDAAFAYIIAKITRKPFLHDWKEDLASLPYHSYLFSRFQASNIWSLKSSTSIGDTHLSLSLRRYPSFGVVIPLSASLFLFCICIALRRCSRASLSFCVLAPARNTSSKVCVKIPSSFPSIYSLKHGNEGKKENANLAWKGRENEKNHSSTRKKIWDALGHHGD